jgi:hypothetical protein
MRNFYTVINTYDKKGFICFVFITGISKFAKGGVLSGLDDLVDISFSDDYSSIFGFTENEIIENFSAYIDAAAEKLSFTPQTLLNRLRDYYDGYFFGGTENVYNPVAIVSFFEKLDFVPYWIRTGSSEYMKKYLYDNKITLDYFVNTPISLEEITSPGEITNTIAPERFLYQAGYLTVRATEKKREIFYYLTYPNYEVRANMMSLITRNFISE